MKRFEDFDDETDDARRCVELAALRTFGSRKLAEEIFVNATESIVVERRRNFWNPGGQWYAAVRAQGEAVPEWLDD